MEIIRIEKVPEELKREFKSHCVLSGITMREGLIRLMGLEIEDRILSCPIKEKEL